MNSNVEILTPQQIITKRLDAIAQFRAMLGRADTNRPLIWRAPRSAHLRVLSEGNMIMRALNAMYGAEEDYSGDGVSHFAASL